MAIRDIFLEIFLRTPPLESPRIRIAYNHRMSETNPYEPPSAPLVGKEKSSARCYLGLASAIFAALSFACASAAMTEAEPALE